jgi:F-type H+-transporting ATPase subunit epsilon
VANTLKLEIVTPEGVVYSEEVDMVTLPSSQGELGVYPNHVPLMTQITTGEIAVRRDGQDYFLAVGEGFVEITGARVAVMTDMAIKADDIDEAQAEQARRQAEARLQQKLSDEDLANANAALVHSLAQLNVKRKHRR